MSRFRKIKRKKEKGDKLMFITLTEKAFKYLAVYEYIEENPELNLTWEQAEEELLKRGEIL